MRKKHPQPTTSTPEKLGPGEYVPDVAFQRIEDLPQPKIIKHRRIYRHRPCPQCHQPAPRDQIFIRQLHDVGDLVTGRPRELQLTYSQHYCSAYHKYFSPDLTDLALPKNRYTRRVQSLAVRLVIEDGLPYRSASWALWRDHRVFVPFATIRTGWKPGGKRASERLESDYLDWALADFSGYIAADELYDGPFCVLSIVDNRTFKRLLCQVLDHDPTLDDLRAFFRRFLAHLTTRKLTLRGITTDASPLYPTPITEVFGSLPHQICEFHLLADLNRAILRVVARIRKDLAARKPKLPRGRPSKANRAMRRQSERLEQKISDLFEHRYLFVQRHLTPSEQATLHRISAGFPHLRTLRQLMDEAYRLFDRRCRTETALAKLAALRRRVQRFTQIRQILQVLFSVNVEKALTFLDDRLFPATSNAVERGNRRYRKMQKTIYRSRGYAQIVSRLALDMFRDAFAFARAMTLQLLHLARTAPHPP